MGGYIQVGETAMRDPVTGDFLPAVPLYVRKEDRGRVAETFDGDLKALFAGKMEEYRREKAKAEREQRERDKARAEKTTKKRPG